MTRYAWLVLLVTLTLVASAVAGTTPQTPLEQMKAAVTQADPEGNLVLLVKEGEEPDKLIVVVSEAFQRESYEARLEFIRSLIRTWRTMTDRSQPPVVVVDLEHNPVGGSDGSAVWAVKE